MSEIGDPARDLTTQAVHPARLGWRSTSDLISDRSRDLTTRWGRRYASDPVSALLAPVTQVLMIFDDQLINLGDGRATTLARAERPQVQTPTPSASPDFSDASQPTALQPDPLQPSASQPKASQRNALQPKIGRASCRERG